MKTKLLTVMMVTVAIIVFSFFKFGGTNLSSPDTSWKKVQKKGSLVIGLDDTFAPMGFRDKQGKIVGFDIDLATEVARRLNLQPVFQPCVWSNIFMELNGNNIDLIWNGVSMNEAREKQVLFSRPYLNNRMVILVAKKSLSYIKSKADLNSKKVAVQSGSPAFDYVQGYKGADFNPSTLKEFVQYPDNYTALLDLRYGGVDAVVLDEIIADYYNAQQRAELVKLEDAFAKEKYGIAFRKTDRALRDKIQQTLNAMENDGTAAKISKKWFGRNVFLTVK